MSSILTRRARSAVFAILVFILTGCHHQMVTEGSQGLLARAGVAGIESSGGPSEPGAQAGSISTGGSLAEASGRSSGRQRSDRLTVLSFNLGHSTEPEKFAVIARHIRSDLAEVPDFMLCQEVVFHRATEDRLGNTAAVLAERLGCHWFATKRRTDAEGLAILSRYPFVFYDALELDAQTSRIFFGYKRTSVMGEFVIPEIGLVRVVNVHFTNWSYESHVRHRQLRQTLEWVAQREREVPADLTILGGDFNIPPGHDSLTMLTDPAVVGPLRFGNYNTDTPTTGNMFETERRVDFIFVSALKLNVSRLRERLLWPQGLPAPNGIIPFRPSDHLPLLHEYSVAPD